MNRRLWLVLMAPLLPPFISVVLLAILAILTGGRG